MTKSTMDYGHKGRQARAARTPDFARFDFRTKVLENYTGSCSFNDGCESQAHITGCPGLAIRLDAFKEDRRAFYGEEF